MPNVREEIVEEIEVIFTASGHLAENPLLYVDNNKMNEVPASTPDFLVQWAILPDANISAIHCMGPVRQKYDLISKL